MSNMTGNKLLKLFVFLISPTLSIIKDKQVVYNLVFLIARSWMVLFFIYAGVGKIINYSSTIEVMVSHGIPVFTLPLVILLEIGGGLAIILGFMTRPLSIIMILYIVSAASLFGLTGNILYAELSWASGFLLLGVVGAGSYSFDNWIYNHYKKD